MQSKRCGRCGDVKPCTDFHKNKRTPSGYQNRCKPCRHLHNKAHREDQNKKAAANYLVNKNRILEKVRAYKSVHRKELAAAQRSLAQTPSYKAKKAGYRRKGRANSRRYFRERCKSDINFKLAKNARGRIQMALKENTKSGKTVDLLGCSIVELRAYLESKFYSNKGIQMNWYNWGYGSGKWQIDHIRELASFDLSDSTQQKIACHFSNMQPLWHEDHVIKTQKYLNQLRKGELCPSI